MSNRIKQELEKIEIPKELHERSELGIKAASSEMKGRGIMNTAIKGLGGVAAVAVLSISLTAAVNPGFASSLQGFFKEVTNWKGAVIGTEYYQATDEISVTVSDLNVKNNHFVLPITVTFEQADKAPYIMAEALTFGEFKVRSHSGVEVTAEQIQVEPLASKEFSFDIEDSHKLLTEVDNKNPTKREFKASLVIDKELLGSDDTFTLVIHSFFEHSKGDAKFEIKGDWKLEFSTK